MNDHKQYAILLYIGMILFIAFPVYMLFIGKIFPITPLVVSFGLAIALGFYGTRQYMKFEEKN